MAIFTFNGQDANNSSDASTLVVNNEIPIEFTINSGAETFVGDDPDTAFVESADDLISYTGYDGITYTNVSFAVTFEGNIKWSQGNSAADPQYSSHVAIIEITSGPQAGEIYTLILGNPPDPNAANPNQGSIYNTFTNGNHRATQNEDGVFCFTRGTLIATPNGEVAVETLCISDLVLTADHGPQEIRWIGSTTVPATGINRPVEFAAGALGAGVPNAPLRLSPAHRIVVPGVMSMLLFDCANPLAHAVDLVNDHTILRKADQRFVHYVHLMFDKHELIYAHGALAESFHPSQAEDTPSTRKSMEELTRLFPERFGAGVVEPAARPTLSLTEAKLIASALD